MLQNKNTILIITGPTATGKTSFAIKCAKIFNGEIISADSMQIYKDLNIGTAKATKEEQNEVKHYLIDTVNPNEDYSVQEFTEKTRELITNITNKNKLPILVGGTGLYIRSLIYPFSFCSTPKNDKIRNKYNKILNEKGKEYLYNLLKEKDYESALNIHINDVKRIIRALEICEITNNKKSTLNKCDKQEPLYNVILIVLNLNRQVLYKKINLRVEKMFESGLINEFNCCVNKYSLTRNNQCMQAIGYKELFKLNEIGIDNTKELIKQHTRNYAKRQITFFKSFKDLAKWFNSETEQELAIEYIASKLKEEK